MKTYKQLVMEVAQPRAGDEIEFKAKHDVEFYDHPESEESQHTAVDTVKKKGGRRIADYVDGEDMVVYESNAFIGAAADAKVKGKKKFDFEGEDFPVKIKNSTAKKIMGIEEEMTPSQKEKREEIVLAMKKNKKELKDRYGDDWESVMYATATKQAMKEANLYETVVITSSMTLEDGNTVKISKDEQEALNSLYKKLKGPNRDKMEKTMRKDKKGFQEILLFAKEVYEE
jgi:hypothetical protein